MKKRTFLVIFVTTNIVFIVLHIHKNTLIIKASYQKQRLEKEKAKLEAQKDTLNQQIHQLQNPSHIKKYAQEKLHMQKVKLHQIKKLPFNEQKL